MPTKPQQQQRQFGTDDSTSHLVHVETFDDTIERCVQVIQQINDSHGFEPGGERREADNIAKVDGHIVVGFR